MLGNQKIVQGNIMKKMTAIVLAAGRGTRMKSDTPKVLHKILGKTVISYILESLDKAGIKDIIVVAGYGSRLLESAIGPTKMAIQKRLLGSADAVVSATGTVSAVERRLARPSSARSPFFRPS